MCVRLSEKLDHLDRLHQVRSRYRCPTSMALNTPSVEDGLPRLETQLESLVGN
jgi:hypothetical protein